MPTHNSLPVPVSTLVLGPVVASTDQYRIRAKTEVDHAFTRVATSASVFGTKCVWRAVFISLVLAWSSGRAFAATIIPPEFAAPPGLVDTNKPGFKIRTVQVDFSEGNSTRATELMLAGKLVDPSTGAPAGNVADLTAVGPDGYFTEESVINYDRNPDATNGNFNQPDFPDKPFPGIPGATGSDQHFACELLTYLFLKAGNYTLGVNSDDGFRMMIGNQYIATNTFLKNSRIVGEFDGGRGAGDTIFTVTIQQDGYYAVRMTYEQDGGDANWEFFSRVSGKNVLVNDANSTNAIKAYRETVVRIVADPADVAVRTNVSAAFVVVATGSPAYQWQKAAPGTANFTDIAGATSASYSASPAALADSGTQYRVKISAGSVTLLTHPATLTVDVAAPTVSRVSGSPWPFTKATVYFSKPVEARAATNLANYSIGSLTISGATISEDGSRVTLNTSKQTSGAKYTLTVSNLKDPIGNVQTAPGKVDFAAWVVQRGFLLEEFYYNHAPNSLDEIHDIDAGLAAGTPVRDVDQTIYLPTFEKADDNADNYTDRISGFIIPPLTGDYVFYISTDDPGELYLSTDDNPANKKLIAIEPGWNGARNWVVPDRRPGCPDTCENRSNTYTDTQWPTGPKITLQAGKMYYVELVHSEGGGGDNAGVAWQLPGGRAPSNGSAEIPGTAIATWVDPGTTNTITITQQPQSVTALESDSALFFVAATTDFKNLLTSTGGAGTIGSRILYQWQKAAPGSSTFLDITNATRSSYTTPAALADSGSKYQAILSIPGLSVTSSVVSLTVTTTPPASEIKFTNIGVQAGKVTIQWSGAGALQSALEVTGPWTDVTGASSPFAIATAAQRQFYRLRQ